MMPNNMSLGNSKLKWQWEATTHFLKCLQFETLMRSNAGKDVEALSFTAGGNTNYNSHFGRPFENFCYIMKVKENLWRYMF